MRISMEFARRDDCLDNMVPSDLRLLVGERDKAEAQLAAYQAFVKRVLAAERDMAKPNPDYKERFIHRVTYDLRVFTESQALEDK